MAIALASLVLLVVAVVVTVAFVVSRAMAGRQLDDELRQYDEPVRLRPIGVGKTARAA